MCKSVEKFEGSRCFEMLPTLPLRIFLSPLLLSPPPPLPPPSPPSLHPIPSLPPHLQATLQRASGGLTHSDCTQFAYVMSASLPANLANFSCTSSGIPGPAVSASALLAGPSAAQVCDRRSHRCGRGGLRCSSGGIPGPVLRPPCC